MDKINIIYSSDTHVLPIIITDDNIATGSNIFLRLSITMTQQSKARL